MQANHAVAAFKRELHQARLKLRMASPKTKAMLMMSLILSCLLAYTTFHKLFITDLTYLADHDRCPACYGERMCKRLSEANVHGLDKLHVAASWNIKNVFLGNIRDADIVFKKLAHDDELRRIDALICTSGKLIDDCKTNDLSQCPPVMYPPDCQFHSELHDIMRAIDSPLIADDVEGLSEATSCPSPRLLQRMVDRYKERGDFLHTDGLSLTEKMRLVYTLAVNQEPIVLQMFPHGEGWPFPSYIGACGRIIAVENAGKSLRTHYNSHWLKRLDLARQLLLIAQTLSDNATGFRLYFSDLSLDNYAVSENGEVVIADAENIVIVDDMYIHSKKPSVDWNIPQVSRYNDCPTGSNCLSVDVNNLCKHSQNDFNYYAVCRSVLSSYAQDEEGMSGGFLHSLPDSLGEKDEIATLLNECAKPPKGQSREDIVTDLLELFEVLLKRLKS